MTKAAPASDVRQRDASSRYSPAVLLSFVVLVAAVYIVWLPADQVLTGDGAFYVGLAEALIQGHGYSFNGQPHTHYPPGFPLLLGPARLFGDVAFLQLFVALWAAAAPPLLYLYLKQRGDLQPWLAATLVAQLALSYFLLTNATEGIRSEGSYLTLSLLLFWLLERPDRSRVLIAVAAGLTALIVLTRAIGVALPLAFLAATVQHYIRERRLHRAYFLCFALGALAFIGWTAWTARHPESQSYFDLLLAADPHTPDLGAATPADLIVRLAWTTRVHATHAAELLTNARWLQPLTFSPIVWLAGVSAAAGWWHEVKRPGGILAWYALAYLGVLVLWPFDEGPRFLIPLLPALGLFVVRGVEMVFRLRASLLASAMALFVVLSALEAVRLDLSRQAVAAAGLWVFVLVAFLLRERIAFLWRVPRTAGRRHPGLVAAVGYLGLFALVSIGNLRNLPAERAGRWHARVVGAVDWINTHTRPNDRVMAGPTFAPTIHFYTHRPTRGLPVTGDTARLVAAFDEFHPTYLVVTNAHPDPYFHPTPPEQFAILAAAHVGTFRLLHEYAGGRIYSVDLLP